MNALLGDTDFAFDGELEQESVIELRVLYGAQMDSCLTLGPGEYLLGSGDDCTVMLAGQNVAERHAILRFDGATVLIAPCDGVVRNAYGDEIEAEQELVLGLPVELGSVIITVDHADAPWPDPESVTPAGRAQRAVTEGQPEEEEATDASSDPEPVHVDSEDVKVAAEMQASTHEGRQFRRWMLAVLLIAGVGGLGAVAWHSIGSRQAVKAMPAVVENKEHVEQPPAAAVKTLADFGGSAVTLQKLGSGWQVLGYVATNSEYTSLSNAMAAAAPAVEVKVAVDENVLRDARATLDGEELNAYLKVDSAKHGVVVLSGAASSVEEVERIRALVKERVPGVQEVKANLLLPEQLRGKLKERIAAAGLSERLLVKREGDELRLAGKLSMDEIRRWEEVILAFSKDYGNVLPVRATVARFVPKPPVGVQIIVGGAMPYIVTENGEHVNQGGSVDGHTLMSIKEGEVVFEGTQRIRIAR
ncbi:type III secretion system inner membrane ring subunit SctD [Noviherbaspirillum sp. 1P10PC]|uniref:type III secretion system inner membrane ring subunit SctD n=1 Tax=Noviherbaspirillum sp. 1P10PC TaxID=3132292 RepID=UPI0039A00F50